MTQQMTWLDERTSAVIRVGDGRGFIVRPINPEGIPLVITCAHCLPEPPEAPGSIASPVEYTFGDQS